MSANTTTATRPVWAPAPAELADLELLLDGAYPLLNGFLGAGDTSAVRSGGRLADGTPWPAPITLCVPDELAEHDSVELQDLEGAPVAVLDNVEPWSDGSATYVAGPVRPAVPVRCGIMRRLRPPAHTVRSSLPQGPVVAVVPQKPLHHKQLAEIRHVADELGAGVLILPRLVGARPEALVQAVLAARPQLPEGAVVVPIPLERRADSQQDQLLGAHVAAAYGATHLLSVEATDPTPIPVVAPPAMARDAEDRWRPAAQVATTERKDDLAAEDLARLLDAGSDLPRWFTTPAIAEHQVRLHPPLSERGYTVLFTGLSGAGKSTVARALRDELAQYDRRAVSLLDGDVVRRELSSGLGFSAEDRSRNVRRIGWVAAEVTRHGGAAICAPIAPYDADRMAVRAMVEAAGGFVLVHVATPLAECERRDCKGLYSLARSGSLPEFTGVSAPYEIPEDADLVLDTSRLTPERSVHRVIELLCERGWVRPWTVD